MSTFAPIRSEITVHATPKRAFEIFTQGMHRWWPAEYTQFPRDAIVIEPKNGGRWFERGKEGNETTNGKVLDWQPPGRVLFAWQLDGQWQYDAKLVTELEVKFTSDGNGGTHVTLEHRDLDRMGAGAEETYAMLTGGWGDLLKRFADAAEGKAA
jgi:uncharacterized protein YndB with AHSA1/START domain